MCGILGICKLRDGSVLDLEILQRMMTLIRHRGPDAAGVYLDDHIGLGHLRLSIIDLGSGGQPIHNEDGTLWIVYNGEAFNYVELRRQLEEQGHRFYTTSDTEVILHLYEQEGPRCVERLNGQFAFAIWDSKNQELFLARDRMGIRPLHYTIHEGRLIFASEIKSIFTIPGVSRELDPTSLDQIFTFWAVLPGRTAFRDVRELPPGHWLRVSRGMLRVQKYWEIPTYSRPEQWEVPAETLCDWLGDLMVDAVRVRLRADVPVGCYLSGGLDSSGVAALVAKESTIDLNTFGIRFDEEGFDEGTHQEQMVSFLGTRHREIRATPELIGELFAQTLWHCETPLLRTAPVPLYALSGVVNDSGLKVVLTGEGADEVFGGYDVFKEAKARAFWSRQPDSSRRAAVFEHLHGHVFRDRRVRPFLQPFFGRGSERFNDPLYSHRIRWDNTSRTKTFFSCELKAAIGNADPYEMVRQGLPEGYGKLDLVGKAQYLETTIFLSQYLLSSQGDRVAMAHSLETRMPFLDYRLVEFMARVPSKWKILGLKEKHILKRMLRPILPQEVVARRKQPYRAPIVNCLLTGTGLELARDLLTDDAVRRARLFDAGKVSKLLAKLQTVKNPSEIDSMALAGILSSHIIHRQFVENFSARPYAALRPALVVDRRAGTRAAVPA